MEKTLKRKIKKLWHTRLLLTIGGVAVLGFSVLQVRTILRHRPPQPSWTLDLSESVETVMDEKSSDDEKEKSLLEVQTIALTYKLPITAYWTQDLDLALTQVQDQTLNPNLTQARNLAQTQDEIQALTRALALARARARVLDLDLAQTRNLDLDLALDLDRAEELAQALSQTNEQSQAISKELIQIIEQAQAKLQSPLIVLIVSAELEKVHGFRLYQGNTLDTFLSQEPSRARAFLISAILLTASLLSLGTLMLLFLRLQGFYRLVPNSYLIAFLPEECVAELGVLHRRMMKRKVSVWHIRFRLLQECLMLVWVFYIQVKIDNLGLPPGDRSTDD